MNRRALLLLPLLGLVACAGPVPVAADHYYRLVLDLPARQPVVFSGVTAVERFIAEGELAGRAILHAAAADALEIQRYRRHFWERPLGVLLQGELVRYLEGSGAAPRVVGSDWRARPEWLISARIRRFEHLTTPPARVLVELELGVQQAGTRQLVFRKSYRQEAPQNGVELDAMVAAFSVALAQVFERFVGEVRACASINSVARTSPNPSGKAQQELIDAQTFSTAPRADPGSASR